MDRINFRRIFSLTGILALLVYFAFLWLSMLADHYQRTGSDFIGLYNFGRIYQTKGIQYIYDIDEQEKIEEQVVGHPVTVIFYTHLPYMAPIAKVLVTEDYLASFKRWALILLLLNAINVTLLVHLLEIKKYTRENLFILFAGAFLFDPTFSGFINGQDIALLLFGVIVWVWGMFSKRYFLAGLGLSLATIRPQLALFLSIPFFFRHRRVFWGFALGALTLAAISIGLLKIDGTLRFIESIRYIESTVWQEAHALDMPTVSGILRRNFAFSDPGPVKTLVWGLYGLGIIGFSLWWHRSDEIKERHIGLIVLAGIFLVPYAHYHELTLLLIPIFCILRLFEKQSFIRQDYYVLLPLVVSWLSALGYAGSGDLRFPIMYAVMFILGYILLVPERLSQLLQRPAPGEAIP